VKKGDEAAGEVSQALFDTYVKALDSALREMGVGDLSVGRKMRKLGEAFYGRGKSYEAAFAALPDEAPLCALIARTVYAEVDEGHAPRLNGLCPGPARRAGRRAAGAPAGGRGRLGGGMSQAWTTKAHLHELGRGTLSVAAGARRRRSARRSPRTSAWPRSRRSAPGT